MLYEQIDIFSFMNSQSESEEKYCFDDDINEIHKRLVDISKRYQLSISNDRFDIWSHTPNFGYRMDLGMEVTRNILKSKIFRKDVDDVVNFAKEKEVELSPMWGGMFFFSGKEMATLSFYSTFMDKKRQKIK